MEAAYELLRRAYETEYRYPEGFAGFEANVEYLWDSECWGGHVRVRTPSDIRYFGEIRNADEQLKWEVAAMIGQRWRIPYEEAEGSLTITLENSREGPLGKSVRVEDGLDSCYRLLAGRISQVERRFGDLRFTVNVQQSDFTEDGRTLPVHYAALYWSETHDRHVRTDLYRDDYIEVGGTYLPLERRIVTADDSGITTRSIRFADHSLLYEKTSWRAS